MFERLDKASQHKVVEHCWVRKVSAGEILIQEGETGLAASELYVVRDGSFEVGPMYQLVQWHPCLTQHQEYSSCTCPAVQKRISPLFSSRDLCTSSILQQFEVLVRDTQHTPTAHVAA